MKSQFASLVLVLAIMMLSVCNFAFADVKIDMEWGGSSSDPGALSGNHNVYIAPGSTAPLYLWIYAEVTNGPVEIDTEYGADSALIWGLVGAITETSNGLHGDMSQVGYATPFNSPGATKPVATVINGDKQFAPLPASGYYPVSDYGVASWYNYVLLGHIIYTPKGLGIGSATINFVPDTDGDSSIWYYTGGVNGTLEDIWDLSEPGSYVGASATINAIPEPSTFILFGIGAISLLAYTWRRRKQLV